MDNLQKTREQLIEELAEARQRASELEKSLAGQKQTEKAEQDIFRDFVEQSFIGVYIIRGEKILYANEKMAEIFGYSGEEMMSTVTVPDLVAAENRAMVPENIRRRVRRRRCTSIQQHNDRPRRQYYPGEDVRKTRLGGL